MSGRPWPAGGEGPARAPHAPSGDGAGPEACDRACPAVLAVDDNPVMRLAALAYLQQAGYSVAEAADGRPALSVHPAEVVLTDIAMPEMDGPELTRILLRRSPRPRIVAMSGGAREAGRDLLEGARAPGADAVLPKPFDRKALRDAVAGVPRPGAGQAAR